MAEGVSDGCCAPGRDVLGRNGPQRLGPRLGPHLGPHPAPTATVAASGAAGDRPVAPHADAAAAVALPGGTFTMGTDEPTFPDDREGPARRVRVGPFRVDRCAVTNARFAAFVAATGHLTDAERYGWSFVFHHFVPAGHPPTRAVAGAPWWRAVPGATWDAPEGPGSGLAGRADHPVVHVSWRDAAAFAAWAGGRLPSEAAWAYAAGGGLEGRRFPWGDRLVEGGRHRCNVWQGTFPTNDSGKDGYRGTAPVDAYEPNGFGLYNVVGNVWEWCEDAWHVQPGQVAPSSEAAARPATPPEDGPYRVMKGGSYLCHASYCNRYRLAARTASSEASTTGHVGFRVVYDA